jgi:hypothetical protein
MSDEEVLQSVCSLPIHYRTLNLSPISLVQRSGYLDAPKAMTRERISAYLRAHPELIDAWESWVEDARSAWCQKTDKGYAVYSGPKAKPQIFKDRFEAWAEVIVRNVRHIAKFT